MSSRFLSRSDTNQSAAQSQNMARGLKYQISKLEIIVLSKNTIFAIAKNIHADQLPLLPRLIKSNFFIQNL